MGKRLTITAVVFYGLLGGAGMAWSALRGLNPWGAVESWNAAWLAVGVGTGFAAVVVLCCEVFRARFDWARRMEREFAVIVRDLGALQIVLVALLSSVAEEFIFRGVLQCEIGLWPATFCFALLHFPWNRRMAPWPVFAFAVGACFGWLVVCTGSLIAPLVAHFLINAVNLVLIRRRNLGMVQM